MGPMFSHPHMAHAMMDGLLINVLCTNHAFDELALHS